MCHWHLWVSMVGNAGVELVDAESHPHTRTHTQIQVSLCLYLWLFMCISFSSALVFMFLCIYTQFSTCALLMTSCTLVGLWIMTWCRAVTHLVILSLPWKNSCWRCLSLKKDLWFHVDVKMMKRWREVKLDLALKHLNILECVRCEE